MLSCLVLTAGVLSLHRLSLTTAQKLLECPNLQRIHSFLEQVSVGEFVIKGSVEVFSCKLAGLDKKLSKSLDDAFQLDLASSPRVGSLFGASPVGPMTEPSSRRTLAYLILALNHTYPDYDFSLLRAHHFRKEINLSAAEEMIEERLLEASKVWDETPGFGEQPLRRVLISEDVLTAIAPCSLCSPSSPCSLCSPSSPWSPSLWCQHARLC